MEGEGPNPKSRGQKHIKNKTKYKDKTKASKASKKASHNVQQDKDVSKMGKKKSEAKHTIKPIKSTILLSNWDRYEEIPKGELESEDENQGSDYSLLANAPISQGSHFKFKQDWGAYLDTEVPCTEISELFNLDLTLLNLSLSTIPFTQRCNIPATNFTSEERNFIKRTAQHHKDIYEEHLQVHRKSARSKIRDHRGATVDHTTETKTSIHSECIDTLDFKEKMQIEKETPMQTSIQKMSDLEDECDNEEDDDDKDENSQMPSEIFPIEEVEDSEESYRADKIREKRETIREILNEIRQADVERDELLGNANDYRMKCDDFSVKTVDSLDNVKQETKTSSSDDDDDNSLEKWLENQLGA